MSPGDGWDAAAQSPESIPLWIDSSNSMPPDRRFRVDASVSTPVWDVWEVMVI